MFKKLKREPCFPSCLRWHTKFQLAGSASSLEMKPQISVQRYERIFLYYYILLLFFNDCEIFRVDVLFLAAADLQDLQYCIY